MSESLPTTSQATENEQDRFVALARSLGFLDDAAATRLTTEAEKENLPPAQVAARRGSLTTPQIDVLETLLHRREMIPGYEILDLVGMGGMGVVYRARQKSLQRIVALKTVLLSSFSNPTAASRFEQEAVAVARMHHPHIVAAFDFGQHAGRLFFAMEFIEGEDVEQHLDHLGRFDERSAWYLARQAATALAHAAQLGIVHRDIKPANLLLLEPSPGLPLPAGVPLLKVTDFGLALLAEEAEARTRLTAMNTALGSPHYMAPEQLDDGIVDHRADIYALGATVYHMVTGTAPFSGGSLTKILSDKATRGPTPLRELAPGISHETDVLVSKMMQRAPDERVPDHPALIQLIDELLEVLPAGAGLSSRTERVAPRRQSTTQPTPSLDSSAPTVPLSTADHSAIEPPPSATVPELPRRTSHRRTLSWTAIPMLAASILILMWGGSRLLSGRSALPDRMELSGSGGPLFDGKSLRGWLPVSGEWTSTLDDEQGGVVSGSHGTARVSLKPLQGDTRTENERFRISVFVRPLESESIEFQFGIPREGPAKAVGSLRMSRRSAVAGTWLPGTEEFVKDRPELPIQAPANGIYAVRLERQSQRWWAWINDKLIGGFDIAGPAKERPELLVTVGGGPAWFSDMHRDDLLESPAPVSGGD